MRGCARVKNRASSPFLGRGANTDTDAKAAKAQTGETQTAERKVKENEEIRDPGLPGVAQARRAPG